MKEKSDLWNIISLLKKVIFASFITIIAIVAGFIFYLLKQPSDTISTIDTTGVYNLVNSEDGEIIATDLTPEDINKILEIIDGKN
jgi:hypothetical protein